MFFLYPYYVEIKNIVALVLLTQLVEGSPDF
jgi:hypothetical protein